MQGREERQSGQTYSRPERFYVGYDGEVGIAGSSVMVCICANEIWIVEKKAEELLLYNRRVWEGERRQIQRGDCLCIGAVRLELFPEYIRLSGEGVMVRELEQVEIPEVPYAGYPVYKRSPRIIKRAPKEQIELKNPPEKETRKKGELAMTILPPLATLAVTVGVGMLMGRGKYLLMSVAASGIAITLSIIRFLSEQKERRESNQKKGELYEAYLLKRRKDIHRLYEQEKETYQYNYPDMSQLEKMVNGYSSRIYERSALDRDFLTLAIGYRWEPTSFQIQFQEKELEVNTDEWYRKAAELRKEYSGIEKVRVIDLKTAQFGLVGEKKDIHEQLQVYITQLGVFQSYHDLQIITIFDDRYREDFEWMKWLPHCKIRALNVRGLIDSENIRDQILNSLNQILKERNQKLEESKKEERFRPHFLFIIDEPQMILDHSIMELLRKEGDSLGFSVIYTSYLQANLPEQVGTVLVLENAEEGKLLLENRVYRDEAVRLPRKGTVDLEGMARNLSVLRHQLGTTSHIPENITFLELYGIQSPEELHIQKRWKEHHAEKSLAVPLGVRGQDDIVELNLHEKAHGPHGLVAGTTGSGKSEIIQSYILSLAVNFHPYEVGFLLIDYKGGGMAGLFQKLPHLLGTITNLDGSGSMRALASIKSELARRQKLFLENNVNHINGYMALFREGKVEEPIPHLFLISDEFAELKKEQPEFMKELVSTARIGRSLGVHLILATQKPTGVVDDQIWSNSKFKLALKVQDESDSKEIIKTPDAASITQPGRAYLQVGNNEIYELFQSAWSGASYVKAKGKEKVVDNRVYQVNGLGQGKLLNQDLGGSREEKAARETQLDAVVNMVQEVYREIHCREVRKPWLPALEEKIVSPLTVDKSAKEELAVPIGLVDIPEEQKQEPWILNLTRDGNLMYIASSGYGKSLFLTTVAVSFAMQYPVERVHLFLLDFGNNALIALQRLPHTAEYIALDAQEKYAKWKKLMQREIGKRKKQMAAVYAQNFQVYNQTVAEPMTAWVVLVDNFDAIKEMGFEEEEFFTRASRDGVSLGIYFVITASRTNAIRGATFNNFKSKIAGFNFEKGELMNLVGRSPYTLPEVRGRAMVKLGERVSILQIYSMVSFQNDMEYRKLLQEKIADIRECYAGQEAPHMPIMPDELDLQKMKQFENDAPGLYVGLDTENVEVKRLGETASPCMILGAVGSGKTNLLKVFLYQLLGKAKIVIFDSPNRDLREYEGRENLQYIKSMKEFVHYMDELEQEVMLREEQVEAQKSNYVICIDDLSAFFSHQTTSEKEIAEMFVRAADVGIRLIATNSINKFYGSDAVTEFFKRAVSGVLVSPQGHMNVAPTDVEPGTNEGTLYCKGKGIVVRIPKA